MAKFNELSFDCVVPSAIFFNENLEPACVKAYAVIRNLTKLQGYCYATNAYLADVMNCDVSSVKRWISGLEAEGYLELEVDKTGINWTRKIFISDKFKECLRRLKSEPPPAQNSAPPSSKMSHVLEEYINKEEEKEELRPAASPPSQARELSFLLLEAIKKTKPDVKPPNIRSWETEMDRMMRLDKRSFEDSKAILEWLPKASRASNGFSWKDNILSAEAFRAQFDKLQLASKQDAPKTAQDDLSLIKKLSERKDLIERKIVVLGADYVEFPMVRDAYFKVGEPAFREKVLNSLRKAGVPVN